MGLLSRASGITGGTAVIEAVEKTVEEKNFTLDEMGQALKERLRRLPQKKSTPYTALSLIKAYEAFQTGICLSLKNNSYSSYASVGLAIEKLSIPYEKIWSGEKARDRYFKIEPQNLPEIENAEKNSVYWVFPLDSSPDLSAQDSSKDPSPDLSPPWQAIMILGVQDSSDFNPKPVSALLEDVTDKILFRSNQNTVEQDSGEITPVDNSGDSSTESHEQKKSNILEDEIALFHRMNLDFSCIVLENPDTAGESDSAGKAGFCEKVSAMLDKMGTVVPLPLGRVLILLPIVMDRELIVHRLSKTLNSRPLLSFEANNPENVFTRIDSLI